MILTQCAVCATELGLTLGKKCGRCSTRYCGAECQVQHWKEGGHDTLCKKIKKAGGAEQYHANKKYTEAVTVAVEKCAEDTKGQTCFICTQAVHWKTKEGLVRGCSCRGTAGFAHVSCLVEQAKILVADAEERHLDDDQWARWSTCSLCGQDYHGVVSCAFGWACWKTYLGRPETDWTRLSAMTQLGNGLSSAGHREEVLSMRETELSMWRHLGARDADLFDVQTNLAIAYGELGRLESALEIKRDVYFGRLRVNGEEHERTLIAAINYAAPLAELKRFEEAKTLLRKTMPVARRVLGESHELTLQMRSNYAGALCKDTGATLDDLREAVTTLEETQRIARRVLGGEHAFTVEVEGNLRHARAALAARETPEAEKLAQDAFRTARAKIAQERSELANAMAAMTTGDA
jgi:tetratricopeptide (TPR) repeat protein